MDITSRCTLGDPNKLPEGVPQPARMPYVSDKHPRQTLEVINLLRKHRELCDVVLVVGAKKIYAHRVILSACSPYFRYPHAHAWSLNLVDASATLLTWTLMHWRIVKWISRTDWFCLEYLFEFSHFSGQQGNGYMVKKINKLACWHSEIVKVHFLVKASHWANQSIQFTCS